MQKPLSLYFLATKEIGAACFSLLLKNASDWNVLIKGVLTNSRSLGGDSPSVKELAERAGIQVLKNLEQLEQVEPADFIISVQYHEILKKEHIQKASTLAVNLHMAPLPEYRGCNQFSFAIIDNAKTFGTTFHQLTEGTDSGPILAERRFAIPEEVFVKGLYQKTYDETLLLFEEALPKILNGKVAPIAQEELIPQRGCGFHLRKEINDIKAIQADWPIEKQKRYFRATYFPPFDPPMLIQGDELTPLNLNWYRTL